MVVFFFAFLARRADGWRGGAEITEGRDASRRSEEAPPREERRQGVVALEFSIMVAVKRCRT